MDVSPPKLCFWDKNSQTLPVLLHQGGLLGDKPRTLPEESESTAEGQGADLGSSYGVRIPLQLHQDKISPPLIDFPKSIFPFVNASPVLFPCLILPIFISNHLSLPISISLPAFSTSWEKKDLGISVWFFCPYRSHPQFSIRFLTHSTSRARNLQDFTKSQKKIPPSQLSQQLCNSNTLNNYQLIILLFVWITFSHISDRSNLGLSQENPQLPKRFLSPNIHHFSPFFPFQAGTGISSDEWTRFPRRSPECSCRAGSDDEISGSNLAL